MRHTFRGTEFEIAFVDHIPPGWFEGRVLGRCLRKGRDGDADRLEILDRLFDPQKLEACIHEALHACVPDLAEQTITESARDIGEFLWELGYREPRLERSWRQSSGGIWIPVRRRAAERFTWPFVWQITEP